MRKDTAVIADQDARARQVVRNILRGRSALACMSEKSYLAGILKRERELLDQIWFLRAVPSFDEFDGWLEPSGLLDAWPPEGCDHYHANHLETA
eukprot:4635275-Pyramimonas_sp.AAC.1